MAWTVVVCQQPQHAAFSSRYELLGTGRHRATYALDDTQVVKVPLCEGGALDNALEAKTYADHNPMTSRIQYAECELDTMHGQEVLLMERVDPMWSDLPEWAHLVDDEQVGLNQWGQVVAFDYGTQP